MIKGLKKFFFLLTLALFSSLSFSQIVATPTSGCAPLTGVMFTGLSGATNILWTFGDATSSNINNPTHTYANAGTYVVTYTAIVSGNPVTQTLTIKAYSKPSPNFSYTIPTSHCAPMVVCFSDNSTTAAGSTMTNWQWSFGEGGIANTTSSTYCYTYTIPGVFNVTMVGKNSFGCDSAVTKTAIIPVSVSPTVIISANPSPVSSCTVPLTANFSASNCVSGSPTGTTLTYNWNFGNSQTSTQQNPSPVTYSTNGVFTVSLTATDNNSCSATSTVPVTLVQPVVKVLIKDTVCWGTIVTLRDSSDAAFTTWTMPGPPVTNTPGNPTASTFTYQFLSTPNAAQTITVSATIGACVQTKTFVVFVQKITADFTQTAPSFSFSCSSPFLVTYTNTSQPYPYAQISSWSVLNPQGSTSFQTSTSTSPTFTYTQGSTNPYTIFTDWVPEVYLIAKSTAGCSDTIMKTLDTLRRITAYFWHDKKEGCVPLTVTFHDSSFSKAPITNWTWGFSDGTVLSGGSTNTLVTHTFTNAGVYTVSLTITNVPGCTDVSFVDTIYVVNPPVPTFTFGPLSVCPDQSVTITNTTANPTFTNVQHWHVDSDVGYFSHCINDPNPSWLFNHTGTFGFTLTAYEHGCKGSAVSGSSVTVKGPIARGRFFTDCSNSYSVTFTAYLQDATSGTWDYGDGTPTVALGGTGSYTTTHTYTASGNYTATLTGYNSGTGCQPFTHTTVVTVRQILAAFSSPTVACKNAGTLFDATLSEDEMIGCSVGYQWYFDNNPPIVADTPTVVQGFPVGTHSIMLVVRDTNNCFDTARTTIFISSVTASFVLTPTVGCFPSFSINPLNQSTSDAPLSFAWNFGDPGSGGANTSTATNPSHTYTSATSPFQTFTVSLVATNTVGCSDIYTMEIKVNKPQPSVFALPSNSICANTPITLNAFGVANVNTYVWNFGDGSPPQTVSTPSVGHTYVAGGLYTSSLSITDISGCQGSVTYTVDVQNYPIANFNIIYPSGTVACAGALITFSDVSTNPFPGPRNWNLSTGGPIVGSQTTGTIYPVGVYPITLTVTSTYGCQDVITKTVQVFGASADFTLAPSTICKGEAITFTIKDTVNVFDWEWDFGDGTDTVAPVSPISHVYSFHPPNGSTNVTLTYYASGRNCPMPAVHQINIRDVIADFDRNNELLVQDSVHCLGVQDIFNNTSQNATSYSWNFGDGSGGSTAFSPTHTYANPGTYTVQLAINDTQFGCKDTIKKKMRIIPPPTATLNLPSACAGNQSQFSSVGTYTYYTYTWTPSTNLSCSVCPNPVATLTTSATFTISITDTLGCTMDVVKTVYIQEPPKNISWDTSIVIGQEVTIPGYAGTGFNYTWTPTTSLSCTNCATPISNSTVDILYTAMVEDSMGCFTTTNTFTIHIEPLASVDVPTAFTPNGDGINDVIYVDGWGIKKLNYFRIYNRWGQLLFESTDINIGWDGYYNGVPQNMETYIYQVSVETYIDVEPITKSSTFKLIR